MTDLYTVQARALDVANLSLGPDAGNAPAGAALAEVLLGDEAWHHEAITVTAESPEEAREIGVQRLACAGQRFEIVSVRRVPNFERAHVLDCTTDEYYADPCPTPSLSPSIAKVLWSKSPAHAWLAHPKGGGKSMDPTKRMDAGTMFHRLLLGQGKDYVVIDANDWRTNAAKAARETARAAGKVAVLKDDFVEIERAVAEARGKLDGHGLALDGHSEAPIFWPQRVFGTDVSIHARCMVDHLRFDTKRGRLQVIEVKTIESAHPDACAGQVASLNYDIQQAANTAAIEAIHPEWAGRVDYVFLFCELAAPFAVAPYRLDGEFRQLGQAKWDRCVQEWHRCLKAGHWPTYVEGIGTLSAPRYAIMKAQDAGITV